MSEASASISVPPIVSVDGRIIKMTNFEFKRGPERVRTGEYGEH